MAKRGITRRLERKELSQVQIVGLQVGQCGAHEANNPNNANNPSNIILNKFKYWIVRKQ